MTTICKYVVRFWMALILIGSASVLIAEETSAVIDVTDKAAIEAQNGKSVTVQGKITLAEWSKTGKVMNITFNNATHFTAAAFERNRAKLDEGFSGDIAKAMTGANVKLTGKIQPYGGRSAALKDSYQMIITGVNQVTITDATTQPSTQPAGE